MNNSSWNCIAYMWSYVMYCSIKVAIFWNVSSTNDSWNSLWTTRNSRCTTSGPPAPRWESLLYSTQILGWNVAVREKRCANRYAYFYENFRNQFVSEKICTSWSKISWKKHKTRASLCKKLCCSEAVVELVYQPFYGYCFIDVWFARQKAV